jgi:metalloendopeptidase OMA1, mitochondrial
MKQLTSYFAGLSLLGLFATSSCTMMPLDGPMGMAPTGRLSLQDRQAISQAANQGRSRANVSQVASRIIQVAQQDAPQTRFHVAIQENSDANAYCTPQGQIVIYTGLLQLVNNDSELAAVLGHEVAHSTRGHHARQATSSVLGDLAVRAIGSRIGGVAGSVLPIAKKYGMDLPFSRSHEYEADEVGMSYMARAGYDPAYAYSFWQRMAHRPDRANIPAFLSTHPSNEARIMRIEGLMNQMRGQYRRI